MPLFDLPVFVDIIIHGRYENESLDFNATRFTVQLEGCVYRFHFSSLLKDRAILFGSLKQFSAPPPVVPSWPAA